MKRSLFLFAVLSVLCIQFTWAQQKITITGVVKDSQGSALPGVSVSEKGTTTGTMTDGSGSFKLNANSAGTLVFSYIGYLKQEVPVANGTNLNISLAEDQKGLQEVVVTALNIKRSTKALGYSMTEVKGSDVALSGQVNPVNSLQGKVAGVNITTGGGGPQSSARILIRGNNSLSLNNQPLFVVDGVFIENAVTGGDQWGNSQDFGNMMKNLNPDDFESLSVLKGGAATALYGSRGQNGVIIITTKKGFKRKGLGVTLTHSQMYDKAYKTLDLQNKYGVGINETFAQNSAGENVLADKDYAGFSFGPEMKGQQARDWLGNMVTYSPQKNNVLDQYQTGQSFNTNVAVEGGNETTTFRLSYSNNNTTGITPKNKFGRNNFNLRATHKLSSRVSVDVSANYGKTSIDNPAINGGNDNLIFSGIYKMSRNYNLAYGKANYIDPINGGAYQTDPYGMSTTWFKLNKVNTTQDEDNFQGRLNLRAELTSWLTLQLNGDVQSNLQEYEKKQLGDQAGFSSGSYVLTSNSNKQRKFQALLSASKKLTGDLQMDVSAGTETYRWGYGKYNMAETQGGLKDPMQFYIGNSITTPKATARVVKGVRTDAVYAFANFGWRDQLFLDLTGRNDWNSTLLYSDGHGNNSYFYPSASLAWIFSESFKLPSFVTFGKLRASYAGTGGGTDAYKTSTGSYSFSSNYISSGGSQIPLFGFESNTLGNQNLKNEYTRNYEVGADVRFLDNRIGVDAAVYRKNTFNQIVNISLPQESGVTGQVINAGNVQNQGIEVLLNTVPVRSKNFEWTSTLSFTRNKNTIISIADGVTSMELPNGPSQGGDVTVIARAGQEYGMMQTKYAYTHYQAKDASGNNVANASNGKKIIQSNFRYLRSSDAGLGYVDMGSIQPKFLTSWTNSFRYKNFSLNVLLDAKVGGKYSSASYNYAYGQGQLKNTLFGRDAASGGLEVTDDDGTHHDGILMDGVFRDGTSFTDGTGTVVDASGMSFKEAYEKGLVTPRRAWQNYFYTSGSWSTGIREHGIFTSSWVAVREVTIGYNVPAALYAKLKLSTLRVNLIGRNLFYLYNSLPSGLNPEGLYNNSSASSADYGGVPFVRSMGFNIQASF